MSDQVVFIAHGPSNEACGTSELLARALEKEDVHTNPNVPKPSGTSENLEEYDLILVLINNSYVHRLNEAKSDDPYLAEFEAIMKTEATKLPVVIEEGECQAPSKWGLLRSLGDLFYIDIVPNDSGVIPAEKMKEFTGQAVKMSGVTKNEYFITAHGEPNWRSYVQEGSPYLEEGFRNDVGYCGGGGIFQAYDKPTKGAIELNMGSVKCWANDKKTDVNMLEWRLFRAGNKYLVTSDRADTAPGWSITELFYARGTPTIGDDQLKTKGDGVKFHIFNSHNWSGGNHAKVMKIHEFMSDRAIISWVDEHQLLDDVNILNQLQKGIDDSACVGVYVTKDYIEKCSASDDMDNCKREFNHYSQKFKEGKIDIIVVVMEPEFASPSTWKALKIFESCPTFVVKYNDDESISQKSLEPLFTKLCELMNIETGMYYITMKEWRSYVNYGSYYTGDGYSIEGSCGAGGVFEAFNKPSPGLVKMDVQGATFYASENKVSIQQLEWRCYYASDETRPGQKKYLVTSDRKDMAPGWTFKSAFYARGRPSNGDIQPATI